MRTALAFVLLAACGISNKVAPDGGVGDGAGGTSDGAGSGSGVVLSIELTDKPASLGKQASVSFSWNVTAGATVDCRMDSDAYAPCTSPHAVASLPDAAHTFDARATLGDQTASAAYAFTVDTTAPALVITGQPPAMSPVATAQFHFSTDDATTVTCQLDTAAAAPCTTTASYSALADGSHTFTLSGTDGAGNTATKTYTWTIDTSAPSLTITIEPPNPTNTSGARFEFTIGNSTTVTCQLDSGTASACTSPQLYSGLADGNHTFTLRGTNGGGQTTTQAYTWLVDTTAPVATISSQPAANSNVASGQFAFTVTGASTVTCALDGGTPATCSTTYPYSLPDGSHTFVLKASDLAGNVTTKTVTWTIDTVPPTVAITSHPSDPSMSASATFQFTVSGATSTTCKLDSGSATACSAAVNYSALADGSHTFVVAAADAAGNSASQSFTWTVDTTPPSIVITGGPNNPTNATSATFSITVAGATTETCQLDSGTPNSCTTSFSATGLSEQPHVFTVRASDAAGNQASQTYNWTVDLTPPSVVFDSVPAAKSTTHNISFSFHVSDGSPSCNFGINPPSACSSPASYTLADGSYSFSVSTTDAAGNFGINTYSFGIDATLPSVSITGSCDPSSITWTWSGSDANLSSCSCTVLGAGTFDCTTPGNANYVNLTNKTFTMTCTDTYGNTRTSSKTINTTAC